MMIIMTPAVLLTITKYFDRAELGEWCVPPKGVKGPRGDSHVNVYTLMAKIVALHRL